MNDVRRWPIVAVIAAAVLVALLLGNRDPDSESVVATGDAATLAPDGTRSGAWFCPGLPATLPLDAQTVTISNIDAEAVDAIVTVYPDDGAAPVSQTIPVAGNSVNVLGRATFGPPGGLVVETFARHVVVEHGIDSDEQFAIGPCASQAHDRWFFAAGTTGNFEAGTTGRPVEQWLTLFNPYGTDARVRVSLRENEAVPDVLETIDVPRRSRVVLPIHERAVRKPQVAVEAHATSGRVVASQAMVFGEQAGYTGVTLSLGATAPAASWTFADGVAAEDVRMVIAVVNPGLVDTEVDVMVSAGAVPLTVPVRRDAVVWVQVGGCGEPPAENCVAVPPDTPYTATVASDADTPIVAEQLVFSSRDDVGSGVAALMGTPHPTRLAIFARAAVGADRASIVAVANPAAAPVRATLRIVRGGVQEEPEAVRDLEIAPGQRVTFDMNTLLGANDGAIVISATGPIVADRSVSSEDDLGRADAILGDR